MELESYGNSIEGALCAYDIENEEKLKDSDAIRIIELLIDKYHFSQVAAALGLAQNVAALRALATEGIQKGHMTLHSRNIAKLAGVPDDLIEEVAKRLVEDKKIRVDYAKEVLKNLKK